MTIRVLLVDDEPAVRQVLGEQLVYAGYEVVEREDGAAALRTMEQEPFDALVTDLTMPGLDGVALIREAQSRTPGLCAILVTGYAGDATRLAVEEAVPGPFTLLQKPVRGVQLVDQIELLVGQSARTGVPQSAL